MDKKIDIDTLKAILRDHLEDTQQAQILRDINEVLNEEASEKQKTQAEKPPAIPKKQVVIITALPEGVSPKVLEEFAGFITEIPEEEPTQGLKFKINDVRETYKVTRKAKKNPADCLADLFEVAGAKLFKENGILKKPKGPLEFIFVANRA
jgi:methyl coenzyme M reductase subunit C-like uncharacterized protein (methanogenesis marker protein 7)